MCRADDDWRTLNHERGTCALYGTGGHRTDGDALDKPSNEAARVVPPDAFAVLQSSCPQLTAEYGGSNGTYCCDERQIHDLSTKVCCLQCECPKRQYAKLELIFAAHARVGIARTLQHPTLWKASALGWNIHIIVQE